MTEITTTGDNRDLILKGQMCPYCGGPTRFVSSKQIYDDAGWYTPRNYYICFPLGESFPTCLRCDAQVGCHQGSTVALGRLADAELRSLKNEAHAWFDPKWQKFERRHRTEKHVARNQLYIWLSREMQLPFHETHIGMFNADQCRQAIAICKATFPGLKQPPQQILSIHDRPWRTRSGYRW